MHASTETSRRIRASVNNSPAAQVRLRRKKELYNENRVCLHLHGPNSAGAVPGTKVCEWQVELMHYRMKVDRSLKSKFAQNSRSP
jgi:hypothetical protein